MMHGQDVDRYTAVVIREEIWQSLSDSLELSRRAGSEEVPFWCFGGEQPTEVDAVVFGFVVCVLASPA